MFKNLIKAKTRINTLIEKKKEELPVTVAQIHATFFSEVNRLYEFAINKTEDNVDNEKIQVANDLGRLGFNNCKTALEASTEVSKKAKIEFENRYKEMIVKAIRYYHAKYPFYKFITKESIMTICEKYNLILGPSDKYIGEIPKKNIEEMMRFKIDDEDTPVKYKYHNPYLSSMLSDSLFENASIKSKKEVKENNTEYGRMRVDTRNMPIMIAAPAVEFNMEGMLLHERELKRAPIQDPVVFYPVLFDGNIFYLIMTAWGDEASDNMVVNEIKN
jgi:hypothetical protein